MARQIRWPWRRREQESLAAPEWPPAQTGRPTWATEQQQLLPAVKPGDPVYPVYLECDG